MMPGKRKQAQIAVTGYITDSADTRGLVKGAVLVLERLDELRATGLIRILHKGKRIGRLSTEKANEIGCWMDEFGAEEWPCKYVPGDIFEARFPDQAEKET